MPADIPFGFGPSGGDVPDPNDPRQMQQFLSQLQQLFATPSGGPVNWDLARQLAQAHLTGGGPAAGVSQFPVGFAMPGAPMPATEPADPDAAKPVGDPAVTAVERAAVIEALRLADLWLEPESALPSGVRSTAAWSRGEWLNQTLPIWRKLCDPVAARMVSAMTELVPEEMRAQMGPMTSMVASLGGALLGGQLGTALGSLAAEVLSAGDIGLPLGPAGTAALLPANIAEYGKGLEVPDDQVRLYVALREAAHQRLFGHVPWLRGHVFAAVEAYAAGIHVDREAIEEAMSRIDPSTLGNDPQELVLEGIFTPEDTPQQRAALARLETALALVEGWVCHVVDRAAGERLPDVVKLSEAFRRRRAAGGPAEQTFAALVGLELRPRRLREATALWNALTEHRGVSGRDALWGHPDLLPDEEAFADPDLFARTQLDLGDLGFGEFGSLGDPSSEEQKPSSDEEKPPSDGEG
ncbi:zinc-dependent metalloprotease [Dactylosporangium sp. CA-139114]|uniref:zinc-dependent metalloprotease n=1 Tax=Dactylosporangium sp. CA-139114 TaxID=3239931 RepID=UPI003D98536F